MFSTRGRERHVLRGEQIKPADAPITKANAKKIYRDYMLQTGHLDKDEVGHHVECLADDMNEFEEDLKMERDDCRENLAEEKRELAHAKQALKVFSGTDDEEHWQDEVQSFQESVQQMSQELEAYKSQLAAFKSDKRAFLVEYINREIYAEEWESVRDEALKADAERLGKCYRMKYRDAAGENAERDTGPLVPEGGDMLTGYCFLRGDRRTFKVSRITQLQDLRLDMTVDPRSLFASAPERVPAKEPSKPISPVPSAWQAVKPSSSPPSEQGVSFLLGMGIFFLPYIFAWVLLRPGYSAVARAVAFTWLGLVVAGLLAQ